jgi:uncharacterized membrane protein YfcA
MTWHEALPVVIFTITFVASVLSGMTGGGGGYVVTPLLIAIGFTPQQSIATAKLWALGIDSGSIAAYRHKKIKHTRLATILAFTAVPVGIISFIAIRHFKNENLQLVMGLLNLAMIPVLFVKHHAVKSKRRHLIFQTIGYSIIVGLMLLQGIFASGVGSLISVFLIAVFGISVLESNLIKRRASLVSDFIVLAGLVGTGLINIEYGLLGMAGGLSGGYIGSKFALKEGEKFARYALMLFMLVSGVYLIASS